MQTFLGKNDSAFHYNGDLSGEVIITNQLDESSVRIEMSDFIGFSKIFIGRVIR